MNALLHKNNPTSKPGLVHNKVKPAVQPKLTVNEPGDVYEQEADAMADSIMRMADTHQQTGTSKPVTGIIGRSVQRKCAHCEEEEKKKLMRKAEAGSSGMSVSSSFASSLNTSKGGGSSLPQGTRRFMEGAFSTDFSTVKIHTDSRAAALSEGINAKAFTYGSDIYFNSNQYSPNSVEGKKLLSHELTHVVQQGGSYNGVQRRVRESPVVSDLQPGAQVCMVHLHGDEQNAFHTAQNLHGRFCSNFVHLTYGSTPQRLIHVDSGSGTSATTCTADPNRIFNDRGIDSTLRKTNRGSTTCNSRNRRAAKTELQDFRDNELMPAIDACRAGAGGTHLPVVAFHNNTNGSLSINSYSSGGTERGATETNATRLGTRVNPHIQSGQDADNFLLVTQLADFDALSANRNVVLQSTTPTDDGSLSVLMAAERYINIESQEDTFVGATDPHFIANLSAGEAVMHQLGAGPCATTSGSGTSVTPSVRSDAPASIQRTPQAEPAPDGGAAEEEQSVLDRLIARILRLLEDFIRWLSSLFGSSAASLREPIPTELASRCRTFNSLADLDTRKAHWQTQINTMASSSITPVVRWIIGLDAPPRAARRESEAQKECLLDAIELSAASTGSPLQLPTTARSTWTESGHRNFTDQRAIWERKFNFTGRRRFDRITPTAVATCPSAGLTAGQQWDPANPTHQTCWASLSDDQKQREILQASSAPGISRHHWGSDFDLFSVEPTEWTTSGTGRNFADEYTWLQNNAASYGFIQSFTSTSVPTGGVGYMEEKWHWSYYPVSQALLEFARTNRSTIQSSLRAEWGTQRQFSFISSQWSNFMFNVSSTPIF